MTRCSYCMKHGKPVDFTYLVHRPWRELGWSWDAVGHQASAWHWETETGMSSWTVHPLSGCTSRLAWSAVKGKKGQKMQVLEQAEEGDSLAYGSMGDTKIGLETPFICTPLSANTIFVHTVIFLVQIHLLSIHMSMLNMTMKAFRFCVLCQYI